MALRSPIHALHAQAGAMFVDYGISEPQKELGTADTGVIPVVGTYGELALEYTALRRHCVVIDLPQRTTLSVTGPDAQEFLNRMLTQELKDIAPGEVRRSLWLNRKGRIDADLRVLRRADQFVLEVDALAAGRTLAELSRYLVMEEVAIADQSLTIHRFALHGPAAPQLLQHVLQASPPAEMQLLEGAIAGKNVIIYCEDTCGVPGYELIVAIDDAAAVFELLIQTGHDPHHGAEALRIHGTGSLGSSVKLRPAGWHAYNIARIEAGTPIYNIDFGPSSLPAETGVLNDRVNFKKGCYLGQEVVARMAARGHPKQILKAFSMNDSGMDRPIPDSGAAARMPTSGDVIGSVTSSTYSPILGAKRIGFAMVKFEAAMDMKDVTIDTRNGDTTNGDTRSGDTGISREPARLQDALRFLTTKPPG